MKYMLMFCQQTEGEEAWYKLPEEERQKGYAAIGEWFQKDGEKITGGEELQPVSTATTVVFNGSGSATVTDGPFIEAKETVGGFAIVDVKDLDEALDIAKGWPPGGKVEVRPVVERH